MRDDIKLKTINLDLFYGKFHALKDINVEIKKNAITSIIGPSGCGKSTLLRVFNRMNDLIASARITGECLIDGENIIGSDVGLNSLRKKIGLVFQRPNPFPLSIYENVVYGVKIHNLLKKRNPAEVVEDSLKKTGLWNDVRNKLGESAMSLSPEQKQRLCISRLIAMEPEVILMDEPCSALDPIATAKIEELAIELKSRYTIVIVTHNMQQAARISDYTAYMLLGDLVEYDTTDNIFTRPKDKRTEDYITGKFG